MNVVEVRQVGTGFSGWMRDDARGVGIDLRTGDRIESEDTEGFTGTGEIVAVHNPFRPEFPESLLVPDRRAGQASSELATMTKINGTASDPGGVTTTIGITGLVRGTATMRELVADGRMKVAIIDTATSDTTTKSGKKETVAGQPWEIDVRNDGPQA